MDEENCFFNFGNVRTIAFPEESADKLLTFRRGGCFASYTTRKTLNVLQFKEEYAISKLKLNEENLSVSTTEPLLPLRYIPL